MVINLAKCILAALSSTFSDTTSESRVSSHWKRRSESFGLFPNRYLPRSYANSSASSICTIVSFPMVPTSCNPSTSSSVRQRTPLVTWLGTGVHNGLQRNQTSSNAPTSIMADASDSTVGAVLQQYINNSWCPIAYFSGTALSIKNCSLSTWLSSTFVILLKAVSFFCF